MMTQRYAGRLLRPSLFAFGFTATALGLVGVKTAHERRSMSWFDLSRAYDGGRTYRSFPRWLYDAAGKEWVYELRRLERTLNQPYAQVVLPIVGLNAAVFMAWKARGASCSFMSRYFLHDAARSSGRGANTSMLLSTFSHQTLMHLGFNMYALWSFAPNASHLFGVDNFLACYLSAGVMASWASTVVRGLTLGPSLPSLGASGAVLFVASTVAFRSPDAQFGLIFLPGVSFDAETMMFGVIAMDVVGLLMGWRFFDHAAHLAGAGLGFLMARSPLPVYVKRYEEKCSQVYVSLTRGV